MHLQPLRAPRAAAPQCSATFIVFRHPGYFESENVLFALPPLDIATEEDETDVIGSANNQDGTYGVHHSTALVAGQIIAGNSFETAYLSYDRAGDERVCVPLDGLLTRGEYYLQVPQESSDAADDSEKKPWAATPNFQHWRFPHNHLPEPWASLPRVGETSPRSRSQETLSSSRCIITAAGPSTADNAHVIPQSSTSTVWFNQNGMRAYARSNSAVTAFDSPGNRFRLRSDLHKDFDNRAFALVPKPVAAENTSHALAVHFLSLSDDLEDSATEFHNQLVHGNTVPTEYLFARFAYTVFGLVKNFVLQGVRRRLALVETGKDDWTTKTHDMNHRQRDNLYGGGGSRSSSPRKRTRSLLADQIDDDELSGIFGYQSGEEDEERRGRSRSGCWDPFDEQPTPPLNASMASVDSRCRKDCLGLDQQQQGLSEGKPNEEKLQLEAATRSC
ncbi:hypothetical protein NOR_08117 [Metarhizium rileyi]|uniref:HNH nuclease domain-containing protein n=1 Tax=Metarhizium rileyi (strain RCEF 4871) TaxID=1649241 RepID=A0A166WXE0_METRR|nr:hypothetical protein NOR_08117 [Metarhizium rileyi RCEF 4871]